MAQVLTATCRVCGWVFVVVAICSSIARAQATLVQGSVSGTWEGDYVVVDDCVVSAGSVLTIEPGANLLFSPGTRLIVDGQLLAQGTEAEPITLRSAVPSETWGGVRINGHGAAPVESSLAHCEFSDAVTAIYAYIKGEVDGQYSVLTTVIEGCEFDASVGTAIYAESYGWNWYQHGTRHRRSAQVDPVVRRCRFTECEKGVVVYPHGSCSTWCAGGRGNASVENCSFENLESALEYVSASYNEGFPVFVHNTINGGTRGIYLPSPYDGIVKNNVFVGLDVGVERTGAASDEVYYNCFFDCAENFIGYPLALGGALVFTNPNGDPCDAGQNIFMDPMFSTSPYLSALSPCIDAGLDVGTTEDADGESRPQGRRFDLGCDEAAESPFIRGDANSDGVVELSDAVTVLGHLFQATATTCDVAQDCNDDEILDVADPVFLLAFLFSGGSGLPEPYPTCGNDPTVGGLACESNPACP